MEINYWSIDINLGTYFLLGETQKLNDFQAAIRKSKVTEVEHGMIMVMSLVGHSAVHLVYNVMQLKE